MPTHWWIGLFSFVVALPLSCATLRADSNFDKWADAAAQIEAVAASRDVSKLANLDRRLLTDEDSATPPVSAAPVLLRLAELREEFGYADPWYTLNLAREIRPDGISVDFDERLARGFMLLDLPWATIELLSPRVDELSRKGKMLLRQADKVLLQIRKDVHSIAPEGVAPYAGLSPMAKRTLDLIGIPPKAAVKSYLDPNDGAAYGRSPNKKSLAWRKIVTDEPLLTNLLRKMG